MTGGTVFLQMPEKIMARPRPKRNKRNKRGRKWSAKVTGTSNALDLKQDIFKAGDPAAIARSLKRSATRSRRRKGTPYRSAMSMLNFYINRAGANLPAERKKTLEAAKDELRKVFGRTS